MRQTILTIFFSIMLLGCSRTDKPLQPNSSIVPNITIAQLKDMCKWGVIYFKQDVIVSGTVISSDREGYINKEVYFDDGTAGAKIRINMFYNSVVYPEGVKIAISLDGLGAGIVGDILTIGIKGYNNSIYPLQNEFTITKHIARGEQIDTLEPIECAPEQITPALCGRLVKVCNLKHTPLESEPIVAGGYHRFTNQSNGQYLYIYIDPESYDYGDFLPNQTVDITGIATLAITPYELEAVPVLLPRYHSDIWQ